jgi:hypothetical protein
LLLAFLDAFFFAFHSAFVVFNLLGWIWRATRRLHRWTMGLTLASWTLLGALLGWGYCPLTDWHWDVKRARGHTDLPGDFLTYALERITGFPWDPALVGDLLLAGTAVALGGAVVMGYKDWKMGGGRMGG